MADERKDHRREADPGGQRNRRPWMQLGGVGLELAAAVGGLSLVGYWIDRHYGSSPWGLLVGALLGCIGGFYNLVKTSLAASREAREVDEEWQQEHKKP